VRGGGGHDDALAASRADCQALVRREGHSFSVAPLFLPRRTRRDVAALYAFYRTVDDLVDERPASCSPAAIVAELDGWRAWLRDPRAPGDGPIWAALGAALTRHRIPHRYLDELLDGVAGDLVGRHLRTFAELERSCYLVAGTVGLVLSAVLGIEDSAAPASERGLGIATQRTNVLRDVGEDLGRGLVYLPAEGLARFGCSRERLARRVVDADFVALMRFQIARARAYCRAGMTGIPALSRDSQLPILLAARLYGGILRQIERNGYDVLGRRARTRLPEKLWIAGRSYAQVRRGRPRPAPA